MTSIPNTMRRGAIYWFRQSRRLPSGNRFRATVSLRTGCPKDARRRATILVVRFEELYVRLFGSPARRFAVEADTAKRIFQREFNRALDALEQEREQAELSSYEFGSIDVFLDVHAAVYGYLAKTNASGTSLTFAEWADQRPELDPGIAALAQDQVSDLSTVWHRNLDETAAALSEEGVDTDIFLMDHAMRLRFEARHAAVQEYRRRLHDPKLRAESLLASASPFPPGLTGQAASPSVAPAEPSPAVDAQWARLTAQEMAKTFLEKNPKLLASETGKREAKWTPKTKNQFETAMRLLQKSMGPKPFVDLTNDDLCVLLKHSDGLPPNHHKSPRHGPMTLAEICAEAQEEVRKGTLDKGSLGLNVPTLNRHFRFIRMAHDWLRRQVPQLQVLDWSAFSFENSRNAREQRATFPIAVARKIFCLFPWHGCAGARQRMKPGRQIFHDSLYWVFPIIWYSGMRREEACKLQTSDIARSDAGIWYFDIDVTEAGGLKNASSRRWIPVADELIRLGFIDFVDAMRSAGERLLFPELVSDSRGMGETYYRLGWNKIVGCLPEKPAGLTIHGIRHMVADELKAAGVNEEVRADLLGHTLESETAGRYSKASRLSVLLEAVNSIPVVTKAVAPLPSGSGPNDRLWRSE